MAVQELWEASKNSSRHCVFIITCFTLPEKLRSSHLSVPLCSQCLQPWGDGLAEHPAFSAGTKTCLTPPNHSCTSHSCSLLLLGFVFVNPPLPPSKLTVCVGGAASWELSEGVWWWCNSSCESNSLFIAGRCCWRLPWAWSEKSQPRHLWGLLLFSLKNNCFVSFS